MYFGDLTAYWTINAIEFFSGCLVMYNLVFLIMYYNNATSIHLVYLPVALINTRHHPILGAPRNKPHWNHSWDTYRLSSVLPTVENNFNALPLNSIPSNREITGAATGFRTGVFVITAASTFIAFDTAVGWDAHRKRVHLCSNGVETMATDKEPLFVSPGEVASIRLFISRRSTCHVEKEGFISTVKVSRATVTASDALAPSTAIRGGRTFASTSSAISSEAKFIIINGTTKALVLRLGVGAAGEQRKDCNNGRHPFCSGEILHCDVF
jgi:hypothetical protein